MCRSNNWLFVTGVNRRRGTAYLRRRRNSWRKWWRRMHRNCSNSLQICCTSWRLSWIQTLWCLLVFRSVNFRLFFSIHLIIATHAPLDHRPSVSSSMSSSVPFCFFWCNSWAAVDCPHFQEIWKKTSRVVKCCPVTYEVAGEWQV